jgi:hypothetical protein
MACMSPAISRPLSCPINLECPLFFPLNIPFSACFLPVKSKSSGLVLDVDGVGQVIQRKADDKAKGQLWRAFEVRE